MTTLFQKKHSKIESGVTFQLFSMDTPLKEVVTDAMSISSMDGIPKIHQVNIITFQCHKGLGIATHVMASSFRLSLEDTQVLNT